MKTYKAVSLILLVLFAVTGLLFLIIPDGVLGFFNSLSSYLGMLSSPSPMSGWNFYLILAVGYMYLVGILAFLMFRHPENRFYPLLLVQAKLASSFFSLVFFLLHAHYLIYLANFVVDGVIGIAVLVLYLKMRKVEWA
jgi:hypothetical protein